MGQPVKIVDIARDLIKLHGLEPDKDIPIEFIGLRPGEKLYEEVLSTEENSLATVHPKIRMAQVRENNYETLEDVIPLISRKACELDIAATIQLLKKWVPEFKSHNSEFEKYDNNKS